MRQRGFTLVELLVALSIFAILGVTSWQVLNQVIRTKNTLEEQSQQLRHLQRGFWIIARDVRAIIDRPVRDNFGVREPAVSSIIPQFSLMFTRNDWANPLNEPRSTLQRVGYRLDVDDEGNQQLVRYIWPVLDRGPATEPVKQVLFDRIDRLEIQFIDQRGQTSFYWPPANQTEGQQSAVPSGIRLRLALPGWGEIERIFQLRDVKST